MFSDIRINRKKLFWYRAIVDLIQWKEALNKMFGGKIMNQLTKSYEILEKLRLSNGLYLASPSVDYSFVWLRDSVYEVMPYLNSNCKRYETTYHRILDLFKEYEWKLDIHTKQKPTKPWEYLHSRYDAQDVREIDVPWGHVQHDAIGAVLYGIGKGSLVKKDIVRDNHDKALIQKLVNYLETCRYWMDSDNGMWEEWREVHSSSVGACVAGLKAIRGIAEVPHSLILKGEETLKNMHPYESADRPTDLAQLSLIFPYQLLPLDKAKQVVKKVEKELLRERGVIRYTGDSYYSTLQEEKGRGLPLIDYYGTEAEWTFGLPWLALCHIQFGNLEKAAIYIERTEKVMLKDGSLPELYYASSEIHNGNTPLGWANALYIIAKENLEKLKTNK